MSFFLSSPPQPTYQKSHHQIHQQPSFFTPQTLRTNYFSDSTPELCFQFQPKSPSPLRPTWNAGNVMRRQINDTKSDTTKDTYDEQLAQQENDGSKRASFATQAHEFHSKRDTLQTSSTTNTGLRNPFAPLTPNQTDSNPPRNPFQYQSTSQNLRPTSQINTRIRNNRDARRSLFLDRLRSSRRDERDNNIIERFEKEEYWRERRRREERMLREAEVELDWNSEDVEYDDVEDEGQVGMSPLDEELEVGELVEGWYEGLRSGQNDQQQMQARTQQDAESAGVRQDNIDGDDFMDAQFDFEDSDVEEAFMQVLSQQGGGQILESQQQQQLPSTINQTNFPFTSTAVQASDGDVQQGQHTNQTQEEKDTDMS